MNTHLHTDNPYSDYMQGRQPDAFLPEHSIEYHNPASTSSSLSSVNHVHALAQTAAVAAAAAASSSSSISQNSPFSRHLGRNRACASCRDRKLKCDGHRPICGQCSRAWATKKRSLKAKGVDENDLRELEQPCLYLDVSQKSDRGKGKGSRGAAKGKASEKGLEGLSPMSEVEREKMRLEQEVAELRARLHLQNGSHHHEGVLYNEMVRNNPNSDELSIAEILATTMRSGEGFPITDSQQPSISPLDADNLHSFVGSLTDQDRTLHMDKLTAKAYPHPIPQSDFQHNFDSTNKEPIDPLLLRQAATTSNFKQEIPHTDVETQMIPIKWPADFPSPVVAELLCRVFFDNCHFLCCLFQPSRFFEEMAYGPSSPGFPSFALLHAIFAWSYSLRPDLDPDRRSHRLNSNSSQSNIGSSMPLVKYHCEQVKQQLLNLQGRSGSQLFSLLKAAAILMNVQFGLGHMLEAWTISGISIKLATALYLNREKEGTDLVGNDAKVQYLATSLLRPSSDWMEEEERRRVVFYVFASDRASAASVLWTSSIKETDLTTSLPMCSTREFHQQRVDSTMSSGQALNSADLFSSHLNDPFNLFIKSLLLIGRIGEFLGKLPTAISVQDVKTPEWFNLNHLVSTFSSTIPMQDLPQGDSIDSVRILADLVIHTCALLLHEPLTRLDENSVNMCRATCTGVVTTLRYLNTSQIDATPFSPMFAMTVGITGRVLIRLLHMERPSYTTGFPQPNKVESNHLHNYATMAGLGGASRSETEKMLQTEIDVIFISLCKYGRIWPLAMRQAQAIAGQIGVQVASPELLRHGLFTDRNSGKHIYR